MAEDIDNVINVTDVASKGVVFDTPPVALAPNIMTNVRNVRFRDGAIRKMEGELLLTDLEVNDNLPTSDYKLGDVQYFAVWEEPSISSNQCYYITIRDFIKKTPNEAVVGQKVFIQNAIKSTDSGYLRRDITPPIGTQLVTTSGLTATQTTVGSTTLTVAPNNTGIVVGFHVEAAGVPVGAKVTEINGTTITIDKKTDASITAGTNIAFKLYSGFAIATTGWGHTLFGGGFAFILNNGLDRPHFIKLDPEASAITDIELLELPGWDDYYGHSQPIKDTWDNDPDFVPVFAIGQEIDFSLNSLRVTRTRGTNTVELIPQTAPSPNAGSGTITSYIDATTAVTQATAINGKDITVTANTNISVGDYAVAEGFIPFGTKVVAINSLVITLDTGMIAELPNSTDVSFGSPPNRGNKYYIENNFVPGAYPGDAAWVTPTANFFQLYYNEDTGITVISVGGLEEKDEITIQIRSRNRVKVTCGIIESFGNLIVAGNLKETDSSDPTKVLRRQPGVIKVSDVALTDSFPTNWNPYASSVSTADEFTLSETSVVKDMKTLQSNFYIYSTEGIHQLRLTGNLNLPVSFSSVTETYGALSTKSVAEYDGRHFVVGKNDIYSFTGNPADIKSLCDNRTRVYFYDNLNPSYLDKTFVLANHRENEIWINYPTIQSTTGECNESLIYNYRDDTWTIRDLNDVKAGDIGPVVGGGVPQATLALNNGSSGNNADTGNAGYTNIGNAQIQTAVYGTQPAPSQLSHRWWALKPHNAYMARYHVMVDNSYVTRTLSARKVQKFTWAADTGQYNSSGTYQGTSYNLTWVLYTSWGTFPSGDATKRVGIYIELAPNLTTLSDILDDIVDKMRTQNNSRQGGLSIPHFREKYFAARDGDTSIKIYAENSTSNDTATGVRPTFPSSSAAANTNSIPGNGVRFYESSTGANEIYPMMDQQNAQDLVGSYFPAPAITEIVAGTTVANAPEIMVSYAIGSVSSGRGKATYPMHFDGVLTPTTIFDKFRYWLNIRNPDGNGPPYNDGFRVSTNSIINPPVNDSPAGTAGYGNYGLKTNTTGIMILSTTIRNAAHAVFNLDDPSGSNSGQTNTAILQDSLIFHNRIRSAKPAGTSDTVTHSFPLGEDFTVALSDDMYDPDSSVAATAKQQVPLDTTLPRIVAQYNASFGGVDQTKKYFVPTVVTGSSPNPFSIAWARPPADAAPNVDPITWSVTNGTARDSYVSYALPENNSQPITQWGDSVANLVTTNTGASPAYTTLTRATLKIINNGVSTTVLDKRYGEGPGRLVLEPLSGINGAGESRWGDTTLDNDTAYLALYYNAGTSSGTVPNGVAVSLTNILKDVVTALADNTSLSVVATPDTTNPISVVITPLEYSSTTNYVESFTVSTGAEAQTAPVRGSFIGQNREGQTVAGANSTLASTSVVNTTLSNTRPWSTGAVNNLKKFPIFAQSEGTSNRLRVADLGFDFAGTEYVSFFERDQLSITTTFNTETVNSMVLWADGASREDITNNLLRATLHIRTRGTNASGTESLLTSTATNDAKLITNSFVVATDYKVDARVQGRFINYRIDDAALDYSAANSREWHVSGLQLETLRGGTR